MLVMKGRRECLHLLSGPAMSEHLADLLPFASRHLLSVGQLQLWRLRLRDLINFCEEADVRRIAWSSTPRFLFYISGGWCIGLVAHRCFCTASTLSNSRSKCIETPSSFDLVRHSSAMLFIRGLLTHAE
jgi:hypothetical protein